MSTRIPLGTDRLSELQALVQVAERGNVSAAARSLRVARATLYRKAQRYGIDIGRPGDPVVKGAMALTLPDIGDDPSGQHVTKALLLLAGLALVPDELLKAAEVDGAGAWTRLRRIIIPMMKPAILVALLFRTLDAFRIFDNIFVMTAGAQNTATVSFLTYNQSIGQLQLGMGSALSVLLFLSVALICFIFIKVFKVDLAQARGE